MTRQLPRYRRKKPRIDDYSNLRPHSPRRFSPPVQILMPDKIYRSLRATRSLDGMTTGSADGTRTMRTFCPAWWQVWRWWTYFRAPERGRLTLTLNGRFYEVRCYGVPRPPRVHERRA